MMVKVFGSGLHVPPFMGGNKTEPQQQQEKQLKYRASNVLPTAADVFQHNLR